VCPSDATVEVIHASAGQNRTVTVQTILVAQANNGDVQMGDRVRIVQDRNGVASAIRDPGNRRDL